MTVAFGYAKKVSLAGRSLFVAFGAPPTAVETISMKQYLFRMAYSWPFEYRFRICKKLRRAKVPAAAHR
ncbi:MAG TPA: hypothetical protein VHP37_07475 [Burkholderiales bacterium]|nr:hypothetical protein [Burkholderiales bacterium]